MKDGKKIRCDVCGKIIRTKKFRQILIYITNIDGRHVNCEKELDVCNSCIIHLNFRGYKKGGIKRSNEPFGGKEEKCHLMRKI